LAAALRDAFPVERLVAIAGEMLMSSSEDVRVKAWLTVMERAHGKVADKLELAPAHTYDEDRAAAAQLTDEQLERLEELDRQRDAILASKEDNRVQNPKVLDGGVALLPVPVARALASTDE
jgi:hypothetical protein